MNICILINSFNLGGAEKLMYDVAKVLKDEKFNVVVIAMKCAETELELKIQNMLESVGLQTDTVNKPTGKGRLKSILKINSLLKKYDIDILHTNGQSPDFYGRLAASMCCKVRVITTIHNTAGYSCKIEKILGGFTFAYTAVSEQTAKYCKETLGIADVITINNGICLKRYASKKDNNCIKNIILTVGRVVPQKGYTNIAVQMSKYLLYNADAYWYIVGETGQNPGYYEKLNRLIDERVKERVLFTGAITAPEEYYKKANVFLLPSEFEGFGIVFIEAMAAKLPIISNKLGVMLDLEKANGTFIELDRDKLSMCIDKAKALPETALNYNYEFCKKNYSIEAITRKYIDVYESVIRKHK